MLIKNAKPFMKRSIGVIAAASFLAATMIGCGTGNKDAAITCADHFLKTAESGDLAGCSDYATEEALKDMGWSKDDIKKLKEDSFSSFLPSSDMEYLTEIPEIKDSVDTLVEKLQNTEVRSYVLNSSTYTEKDGVGTVKATVKGLTKDSLNEIEENLSDDMEEESTQLVDNFLSEHPEVTDMSEEDMYSTLYKELFPKLIGMINEKIDEAEGTEQSWTITLEKKDGNMIITKVERREAE